MKLSIYTIRNLLIFAVTIFSAGHFLYSFENAIGTGEKYSSSSSVAITPAEEYKPMLFNAPARLQIPVINVDAKVQEVGVTAKGTMGIPTNFTDVAWYKNGTIPGEIGSAVIDGHVDNGLSLPGVFKKLNDVKIGDKIYIIDKNGTKISFAVSDIELYPYKDVPTEEIFHEDKQSLLRLITCEGNWVKSAKTYDMRLVITAKRTDA